MQRKRQKETMRDKSTVYDERRRTGAFDESTSPACHEATILFLFGGIGP